MLKWVFHPSSWKRGKKHNFYGSLNGILFSLPFAFIKMSIQLPFLVMLADMNREMFSSAKQTTPHTKKERFYRSNYDAWNFIYLSLPLTHPVLTTVSSQKVIHFREVQTKQTAQNFLYGGKYLSDSLNDYFYYYFDGVVWRWRGAHYEKEITRQTHFCLTPIFIK